MYISEIETTAKKIAMITGVDQNIIVFEVDNMAIKYCIQKVGIEIPKGGRIHSTKIAVIDLFGIAGKPTMHGFSEDD